MRERLRALPSIPRISSRCSAPSCICRCPTPAKLARTGQRRWPAAASPSSDKACSSASLSAWWIADRYSLLLEDAHWLDSASWALLWRIRRDVPRLILVVASRPPVAIPDPAGQAEYPEAARRARRSVHAAVAAVGRRHSDADQRAARCHGPATALARLHLCEQTHGHPFFATELVRLARGRALRVVDGVCQLTQTPTELRRQRFPTTMDGVVRSRIDRLRPQQLLALKVASVVGRTFVHRIVDGVHPIAADRVYLRGLSRRFGAARADCSSRHDRADLQLPPHPHPRITYSTLSFAQRRELHPAVASWYERRSAEATQPTHSQEEVAPSLRTTTARPPSTRLPLPSSCSKAIATLLRAGTQSLRSGAAREAVAPLSGDLRSPRDFLTSRSSAARARAADAAEH